MLPIEAHPVYNETTAFANDHMDESECKKDIKKFYIAQKRVKSPEYQDGSCVSVFKDGPVG